MKRHRFSLLKYIIGWNEEKELNTQTLKFFMRSHSIPQTLRYSGTLVLSDNYLPGSKVRSYCLVTGRIRFPITLTATSRHIFYERTGGGNNTGFFMSS